MALDLQERKKGRQSTLLSYHALVLQGTLHDAGTMCRQRRTESQKLLAGIFDETYLPCAQQSTLRFFEDKKQRVLGSG